MDSLLNTEFTRLFVVSIIYCFAMHRVEPKQQRMRRRGRKAAQAFTATNGAIHTFSRPKIIIANKRFKGCSNQGYGRKIPRLLLLTNMFTCHIFVLRCGCRTYRSVEKLNPKRMITVTVSNLKRQPSQLGY